MHTHLHTRMHVRAHHIPDFWQILTFATKINNRTYLCLQKELIQLINWASLSLSPPHTHSLSGVFVLVLFLTMLLSKQPPSCRIQLRPLANGLSQLSRWLLTSPEPPATHYHLYRTLSCSWLLAGTVPDRSGRLGAGEALISAGQRLSRYGVLWGEHPPCRR